MAYDSYGNQVCSKDGKGYASQAVFDTTYTFPRIAIDPLSRQTITEYYGVNFVPMDKGLYGQVKSVTDPNNVAKSYEYDSFGRKTLETLPDGFWTKWAYPVKNLIGNRLGVVGEQHIHTEDAAGLWSETYLDGLGREIRTVKSGPNNQYIAIDTIYDYRGRVQKKSQPHFTTTKAPPSQPETTKNIEYSYDSINRLTASSIPDGTQTQVCYDGRVKSLIDQNGHLRREIRDAFGNLAEVDEYSGTNSCASIVGYRNAITTYQYDALNNLTLVTDANRNNTTITYDSLGRKSSMTDPDMGFWRYGYDLNGNLKSQTDALNKTITFDYDSLNRLKSKSYPDGSSVVFTYDEKTLTNPYALGRLTTMTDASGTTIYKYDPVGRVSGTTKTIGGNIYTLGYTYALGRLDSITYPDLEKASYQYDAAGNLSAVTGYITFNGYNALGQPGLLTFGNNVSTTYQYDPNTFRVSTITTGKPLPAVSYVSLSYLYDYKGNVSQTTDNVNNPATQALDAGTLTYALYPGRAHAIGTIYDKLNSTSIAYDSNGNTTSDVQRTIVYDYDNRPKTITQNSAVTNFVYDGNGQRVKKISALGTRIYIDKLYECIGGSCGKYIFAGQTRIALKNSRGTFYYHGDHQGSTVAATDAGANRVDVIGYHPYGGVLSETGSENVIHKYTGQELDTETGLYNYVARLYDPEAGRFMSADTIVPDYTNPQSLNRYSYVLNNPLGYVDPTGHEFTLSFSPGSMGNFSLDLSGGRGSLTYVYNLSNGNSSSGGDPNITVEIMSFDSDTSSNATNFTSGMQNSQGSDLQQYMLGWTGQSDGTGQTDFQNSTGEYGNNPFSSLIPNVSIGLDSPLGGVATTLPFGTGGAATTVESTPSYNMPLGPGINAKINGILSPDSGLIGARATISTPILGYRLTGDLSGEVRQTLMGPQMNFPLGYGANAYIRLSWQ
jgi:RHS repeat-associated protein